MPLAPLALNARSTLPVDGTEACLVGRVWRPDLGGPSVVAVRADGIYDITSAFPTVRDLCEASAGVQQIYAQAGRTDLAASTRDLAVRKLRCAP